MNAGPGAAIAARFFLPRLLCFVALLVATSLAAAAELQGRIVAVSDGDTVTLLDRQRTEHRVRLSGIDAPERHQAYGERAKQHLSSLVFGHEVVVVWHKRDRYGRIVGRVMVPDCLNAACAPTLDAGLALLAAGLAWHYKQYEGEQPADERAQYASTENDARRRQAGLWREANPVAPWDFRRAGRAQTSSSSPPM